MFLEADVTDSSWLLNAIVRESNALTGTLSTHTLATVTTVVLKGLKFHLIKKGKSAEDGERERVGGKGSQGKGGQGKEIRREEERQRLHHTHPKGSLETMKLSSAQIAPFPQDPIWSLLHESS